MAYSYDRLTRAASLANNQTLFVYVTPDSLATVGTAGYFNGAAAKVADGDLIMVSGAEVTETYTVTSNDGTTVVISSGLADGSVTVAAAGVATAADATRGIVSRTGQGRARDSINVLDYGADPTGTIPSDAAFLLAKADLVRQSATTTFSVASNARRGNLAIRIPAGTYLLTAAESMWAASDTTEVYGAAWIGDGSNITKIVYKPAVAATFGKNYGFGTLRVSGMTFVADTAGCLFAEFNRATGRSIQDFIWYDVSWSGPWAGGFSLTGDDNNSEWRFINCSTSAMAGIFLDVPSGGSDQFLNFWFYGHKHWSTSYPVVRLVKGGHLHVFGMDCSNIGVGLSAPEWLFRFEGAAHAAGVCSATIVGLRAELKHADFGMLYSEWPTGCVEIINPDVSSQAATYTYNDMIKIKYANVRGPIYSIRGGHLAGKIAIEYGSNDFAHDHKIICDGVTWAQQSTPSDVVTYTKTSSHANTDGTPLVIFRHCRTTVALANNRMRSIWDCVIGWQYATSGAAATPKWIPLHAGLSRLPLTGDANMPKLQFPVGSIIIGLRVFLFAGGTAEANAVTYTLRTTEGTPTQIAQVTSANPSLGESLFHDLLSAPFICSTTARSSIEFFAESDVAAVNTTGHAFVLVIM